MTVNATVTSTAGKTVTLPDEVYELLTYGKQIGIEFQGQNIIFHEIEPQKDVVSEGEETFKVNTEGYAKRTTEKTFDELLHEGKQEAQRLLEDQGIASMAL